MFTNCYINEVWKPVRGYEGLYEVSNFGRVKSLNYHRSGKEGLLKPGTNHLYLTVVLTKNKRHKSFLVHRLVWEAFKGPIPKGYEINHLDENGFNNHLNNLFLVTHKENINYGTRNTRTSIGNTNHPNKSKPVLQFTKEGELLKEYPSAAEVERQTGIDRSHIGDACRSQEKKDRRGHIYVTHSAGGFIWKYKGEAS